MHDNYLLFHTFFEGAILQWSLYSSNFGNKLWCFSWSFSSVQNLLWDGSIFLPFHGTEYWCQFREGLSSRFKQRVCIEDPVWSWIIFARTDHVTARFAHGAPAVNSSCRQLLRRTACLISVLTWTYNENILEHWHNIIMFLKLIFKDFGVLNFFCCWLCGLLLFSSLEDHLDKVKSINYYFSR